MERRDVLVVGGGLAGLACARDLARAGTDVLLVEARERVGGRVEGVELDDGRTLQMGGEIVGQVHHAYLGLAAELGLALVPSYVDEPGEPGFDLIDGAAGVVARRGHADLIVANNVLAHVPDLNDFVAGIATLLAPAGRVTIEAPHLLHLIRERQFDTIYHEHFSYLSLLATRGAVGRHGLAVIDVEELPTHGGSLRYHLAHAAAGIPPSPAVERVLADERAAQMHTLAGYRGFADACADVKAGLLEFLIGARRAGRRVAAYGAPAKGNTLLGYCGVGSELVEYTVDRSPAKQGRFLPGSRIPIHAPEMLRAERPDDILILPWNLRDEIAGQLHDLVELGSRLVVAVPRLEVITAAGVEAAA